MKPTPIKKEIVDNAIHEYGIANFANASIREVKNIAALAEQRSGVEFIKLEMGIPGLPAAQEGVKAQIEALKHGVASMYPSIHGEKVIKEATSRFIKAFMDIDISPEGCLPTVGSMQGTFASFVTCSQADATKNTVLFLDPGFSAQKVQLQIQKVPYISFDIYNYRGKLLRDKLESYLKLGNICAIIYSNPNNPTWACLREEELQAIGELAEQYDTIVIEDLAYFAMDFRSDLGEPFKPPYQPTVARYTRNYILHLSGSKAFSYAGERISMACISDNLFHRHYTTLSTRYEGLPFGMVYCMRILYGLSSGTSHSAQYALAAIFNAACDGTYKFRDDILTYGERARRMKAIFTKHNFIIPYDKDMDQPIADGFYFTIGYPNMSGDVLAKELMYYGVSAICLSTTGSELPGMRICTSFIRDDQYDELDRRMAIFAENHPIS